MEDGFSSYSSLYDTSSLLQFCNGKASSPFLPHPRSPPQFYSVSAEFACNQLIKLTRRFPTQVCLYVQKGVGASPDALSRFKY